MAGAPYNPLARQLVKHLALAFLPPDPVHSEQFAELKFEDEFHGREFRREVGAAADAIVLNLRASVTSESARPEDVVDQLMQFLDDAEPGGLVQVPHPQEAVSTIGRLKIELAHLVNEITEFPPRINPAYAAEGLKQVEAYLAAALPNLALIHQIQGQTAVLISSRTMASPKYHGYEAEYRLRLIQEVDRVELFGADIHPIARRSLLSGNWSGRRERVSELRVARVGPR